MATENSTVGHLAATGRHFERRCALIDLIKRLFDKGNKGDPNVHSGQKLNDIRVATCALFLEMANIDGKFSQKERENILSILKKDYELSDEEAVSLVEAATEQLKTSIDLWKFTNLINQNYSEQEKLRIVEVLWKLIYTDGTLEKHEDYLVHKVSRLLRLTHEQLIDAKLKILHGETRAN